MEIQVICIDCLREGIHHPVSLVPVQDSKIYDLVCDKGHKTVLHIQPFKYELLFESGIQALEAGYYREAVSTFAVALERFYEYSIKMLLIYKMSPKDTGHFDEKMLADFNKLWVSHLKFSERQLGAFYALYFNHFGELPIVFDQSFSKRLKHKLVTDPVNLRNKIVHQGSFPSYEEALEYGEAVQEYIHYFLSIYDEKEKIEKQESGEELSRDFYVTFFEKALSHLERGEVIKPMSSVSVPTFLDDIQHKINNYKNLSDYIERRKAR